MDTRTYKFIDLFAGTGGFSLALEGVGFKNVFANDVDSNSEKIFTMNHHRSNFVNKDINSINVEDIPEHDILCAGFPCQPFSLAGKKKGFDDPRANVFWKIMNIIDFHQPQILILENVKNLMSHDNGKTFQTITTNLIDRGYFYKTQVLDTAKITGIPQHRERIYILCFKNKDHYNAFDFDFVTLPNLHINTFLEKNPEPKYYYTNKFKVFNVIKDGVLKHVDSGTIYQFRRHFVRENKSNHCPTLTANMGGGGHNVPLLLDNKGIRKLTPRECFNLQGFPSTYKFPKISDSSLYKLAGNAISIPVVSLIAEKLKTILN
jgi:DNA (cytosine-5)-methyltransferase 1